MSLSEHDLERISSALALDAIHGYREACARAGITQRTLQRWRAKAADDERLSSVVANKKQRLLKAWEDEAVRFMHKCLAKMSELVDQATPAQLRDINGSAKIIGELLVAKGVLGGGQPEPNKQGPAPTTPPSGVQGKSNIH